MKTYFSLTETTNSTNNDATIFNSKEEMLNYEHLNLEQFKKHFKTVYHYGCYEFDSNSTNLDQLVECLDEQVAERMGIDTDAIYDEIVGDEQTAEKLEAYSNELTFQMKQRLKFEKLTPEVATAIYFAESENNSEFLTLIEGGVGNE